MRVLMTLPFPGVKGPLNEHIPLLIEELEHKGIEVIKFNYGRRKQRVFFTARIIHMISSLAGFLKIAIFQKVDIIQLNTSFDRPALLRDLLFVSIARIFKKKIFLKIHGSFYDLLYTKNLFWYLYSYLLFLFVQSVGVLSRKEKDEFSEVFNKFKVKFVVVKNPIDIDSLKTARDFISLGERKFRVLYASRTIKEKGIFDLINAMPHVLKKIDAQFIFAGTGRDEDEALSMVRGMNLLDSKNLTWLGDVPSEKMKDIFKSADLFVFPSHFPEGMPMALVNAMAIGLPIITTKVRFAFDYFKEPDNCLFIDSENPEAFAEKILYLFWHPETRKKMVANNLRLEAGFDIRIVTQQYIKIYEEILQVARVSEKEKVLFVVPLPPPYAGPEVASKVILESGLSENFNLIPLCCNMHPRNEDKGKVNIYSSLRFIAIIFKALWLFISERPKLVYTLLSQNLTGFIRDSVIIHISKAFHRKVVLHFHGSNFKSFYEHQSESFRSYISSTLKMVDGLIIQAYWLKEFFTQFIPEDKIKVIYNPLQPYEFGDRYSIDNQNKDGMVKVLYLSNISAAKGFLVLCKAIEDIVKEGHNIKFLIAGSIIDKERNIFYSQDGKRIDTRNVLDVISRFRSDRIFENRVIFLNEITNLRRKMEVFQDSDIFVLPSYSEGCPVSVMEAMTAGLPLIVTSVGALPEIMKDSIHGFFVQIGNAQDLKEKIIKLAYNPSLRQKMGRQNKLLVKEKFELEKIIPQFNDFFQEFCNPKAR